MQDVKKEKKLDLNLTTAIVLMILGILIVGVANIWKKGVDWGAGHQIIRQSIVRQGLQLQLPWRVEEREAPQPEVLVISPYEDLSTTEQKIVQVWGDYRQAVIAIAIFKCESGLREEAVSRTGDLGVAQINIPIWKDKMNEKFGYTPKDMFDVDKNLEVAHWIYDRADGTEGDEKGSFEPWTCYRTGGWANHLE